MGPAEIFSCEKPRLIYFQGKGRAEAARLCFALGGIDFDDVRLSKEQWMALKAGENCPPFGYLPAIVHDGKVCNERK